jgi:hypothetical protein
MFLQGCGMLFPWNAFITAAAYFKARFAGTPYESNFENYFSVAYQSINVAGLCFALYMQHKMRQRTKIIWPLLLFFLTFVLTSALVLEPNIDGTLCFWITIVCIVACGGSSALLSSGIFGLAANFPQGYTQAIMAGQGCAGMLVSLISLSATWSQIACSDGQKQEHSDPRPGGQGHINEQQDVATFGYFAIATLVLLCCLLSYLRLERNEYARFHVGKAAGGSKGSRSASALSSPDARRSPGSYARWREEQRHHHHQQHQSPTTQAAESKDGGGRVTSAAASPDSFFSRVGKWILSPTMDSPRHRSIRRNMEALKKQWGALGEEDCDNRFAPTPEDAVPLSLPVPVCDDEHPSLPPNDTSEDTRRHLPKLELLWMLRHSVFSAAFVFFVTLAVFPGITTEIISVHSDTGPSATWLQKLWIPLSFLNFNTFDFIGRTLAGKFDGSSKHCLSEPRTVSLLALSRVIFVPLFLMCKFRGKLESLVPYVVFDADIYPIVFMALFALSNGFVGSLAMMQGPCSAPPMDRAAAGTIMVTGLTGGLALGSAFSFLLRGILCECNPFN